MTRSFQVFIRHVWLKQSLKEATDSKRFHHQLLPMNVMYEDGIDPNIIDGLRKMGHAMTEDKSVYGFTAVTAISRARGHIEANFDSRRFGSTAIN